MSRINARILEPSLINQSGKSNLLNIRNSIAPKYWSQYGIKTLKMKRVIVKKGDVFFVKINDNKKRYLQYITNDLKQLNSDVIRCFKNIYFIKDNPNLDEIIKDEIFFHVHCSVKLGIKLGFWERVGNIDDVGTFEHILFRDTNDYGIIKGEEPIRISDNWHVWRINDLVFEKVGKLEGEYRKAEMGMVINPLGIVELLKGNKYPINYPDFE